MSVQHERLHALFLQGLQHHPRFPQPATAAVHGQSVCHAPCHQADMVGKQPLAFLKGGRRASGNVGDAGRRSDGGDSSAVLLPQASHQVQLVPSSVSKAYSVFRRSSQGTSITTPRRSWFGRTVQPRWGCLTSRCPSSIDRCRPASETSETGACRSSARKSEAYSPRRNPSFLSQDVSPCSVGRSAQPGNIPQFSPSMC